MKQNFQNKIININDSGLGCLLTLVIISLFLGAIGLQWIVNGFLIFFALLLITPIIGIWGFRWWLKRNLVADNCPVCNYSFTGFNNTDCRCPNCGEVLKVEQGKFIREIPDGTIEVKAVEVSNNILDES
ncbi:hypothetical protein GM3708_429 [Geminocystis sp. NIES-3708]|uniref:hypothetical protein n=1 Tax=Geminocystis sp. NIES-3708 TaxID=1615909 RepID=UPI0005FC6E2D|nr:hypothetical protein [Geminocystis sp. NIES-3708]BAQ60023.1 hypothetical protein GM3708_429 [Geminocystis sp. NIES-3708]